MHFEQIGDPTVLVHGRRFGRNILHDPRSLQPEHRVARKVTAPKSVKHERHTDVLDQGSLGSCTGNAAVGAISCSPLFDYLPAGYPRLDEALAVSVYSAATAIDDFSGTYPPDDTGSNGLSVSKILRKRGLISSYKWATNVTEMCSALQDDPVIIGVAWYDAFMNPDFSGEIHIGGEVVGGHEIAVVEVDVTKKRFGAWNSWGKSWGKGGYFYISFDTMRSLFEQGGDCAQLLPAKR